MPVKILDTTFPPSPFCGRRGIYSSCPPRARARRTSAPCAYAILNLMPTKIVTETQLLRVIGNTPLQVEVTFLRTASHLSRNTPLQHLEAFYKTFDEVRQQNFDGLIITGAPVKTQMEFAEVRYWEELTAIMDWAADHVFSTMYICWAAQGRPLRPLRRQEISPGREDARRLLPPRGQAHRAPGARV